MLYSLCFMVGYWPVTFNFKKGVNKSGYFVTNDLWMKKNKNKKKSFVKKIVSHWGKV